ncbi:Mitogen-activated protein kinase kinase kinase 5, putative isoform 1 [Hibiscus syriacus]|uniref:CST complex subunit CTC1 n=1 Tax=Hibiscus syriacus TaxID=106335 RepID=A0A6A2ZAP3_HIBSY|nr:Mitogen-activated protein kinase kinase kinase 5, putative isoform 1 [Hibiscus syriacus]
MQDVKILTLNNLLSYGRSHTGSSTPGPPIISDQNSQPPRGSSTSNPNQELKHLAQLDYPTTLVGTLRLPTLTLNWPHENCLQFSEDSVAVCCDIAGFDLRAIVEGSNSSKSMNIRADCHSFTVPLYVYFCGPAWCWHSVLIKLIGKVATISGFMKKLAIMGKQESVLMLVTAENTVLYLPRLLKKRKVVRDSYEGTVKNVYMQGMVVELDKEVWLLLTNQSLMPPHGLRIGAVISIRNVHFVDPQFSWATLLVLGACFNTSIIVKSLSPLNTRCLILSYSQSRLGDFIETLAINIIISSDLTLDNFEVFQERRTSSKHGVLMEFKKHESCCSVTEPYHGHLKLVIPGPTFVGIYMN